MDNERTKSIFMSNEEKVAVSELRQWVENEADFKSRNEDKFLLMFLRSCNLDQRLSCITLTKYYQNKMNIPQWWTNRAPTDHNMQQVLNQRFYTQCICNYEDQPVIGLNFLTKLDLSKFSVDEYLQAATLMTEYLIQLENCQQNGYVWVLDVKDFSLSAVHTMIILKIAKKFLDAFYVGLPVKLHGIHVFNVSFIVILFFKTVICPFLPSSLKDIIHFHDGDLKSLSDFLPAEWLPEELGGSTGAISQHHDVLFEEIQKMNDYFLEDVNFKYCK